MKTMTTPNDEMTRYLTDMVEARKQFNLPKLHGWLCLEHFVLQHGRFFSPKPLPENIRAGRSKECFKNSAECALHTNNGSTLYYCEGYAAGIIPVIHAWLANAKGEVIDRTWVGGDSAEPGFCYFGIPFKTEYVRRAILERKSYMSMLDDWERGWPLLNTPVESWLETEALEWREA